MSPLLATQVMTATTTSMAQQSWSSSSPMVLPLPQQHQHPPAAVWYPQLQKRLRCAEDIPCIPSLERQARRQRLFRPEDAATVPAVASVSAPQRPFCTFLNYMGQTRTRHYQQRHGIQQHHYYMEVGVVRPQQMVDRCLIPLLLDTHHPVTTTTTQITSTTQTTHENRNHPMSSSFPFDLEMTNMEEEEEENCNDDQFPFFWNDITTTMEFDVGATALPTVVTTDTDSLCLEMFTGLPTEIDGCAEIHFDDEHYNYDDDDDKIITYPTSDTTTTSITTPIPCSNINHGWMLPLLQYSTKVQHKDQGNDVDDDDGTLSATPMRNVHRNSAIDILPTTNLRIALLLNDNDDNGMIEIDDDYDDDYIDPYSYCFVDDNNDDAIGSTMFDGKLIEAKSFG
jgi:hypothetical protein